MSKVRRKKLTKEERESLRIQYLGEKEESSYDYYPKEFVDAVLNAGKKMGRSYNIEEFLAKLDEEIKKNDD